jgi:hypothetical protein
MKYKELKSIVEQVINELNLAQGKNRIPKKNLDPVGKEDGDVDNDGDKDKTDKYLLKKRKAISKNITPNTRKVNEVYSDNHGIPAGELKDLSKEDQEKLKKLQDAMKKAEKGDTTDLMSIISGINMTKMEGYKPEEDDDVLVADPDTDIEEPQRLPKRKHPLMPPDESPESEPKMEEEIKKTVKDLMSRYKSLKK